MKEILNKCSYSNSEKKFDCGICLNLVFNPQICDQCEMFIFCKTCYIPSKKNSKCPSCRKNMNPRNLFRIVNNELMDLETKCPNEDCTIQNE